MMPTAAKKPQTSSVNARKFTEAEIVRLGRSLRRMARTCNETMKYLGIQEEDVRFARKKTKPTVARKGAQVNQAVAG